MEYNVTRTILFDTLLEKIMNKALLVVLATVMGLSGCASMGGGYGSSSGYNSSRAQGREVLPGMNAKTTGAVLGGAAGAVLTQRASGPVQFLVVAGSAVAGALFGDQFDESARQAGRTNCTWRYAGTVDPSGTPHQSSGYYDCNGGNSTVGNRNYPPIARPQ